MADLVREAKQIASSGPQDWFLWQRKASGGDVRTSCSEDVSKLHQSTAFNNENIASLNSHTNM